MTINIVRRRNIFRATFLRRSTLIDFIQNTSTSGSRKDKSESTSNILFVDCAAGLVLVRAACVSREDKPTSQNPFVKLDVYLEPISFEIPRKFVIELRGAVVGIEGIDPEFSYGETSCIAPGRRIGDDDHFGVAPNQPSKSPSASLCICSGSSVLRTLPRLAMMPCESSPYVLTPLFSCSQRGHVR
jgi:hypothetical protein